MDSVFEQTRGVTRRISLNGSGEAVRTLEPDAMAKFEEYLSVVYDGLIGRQYSNALLYP